METCTVLPTQRTFEDAYCLAVQSVVLTGEHSESRNGKGLTELTNVSFSFSNPLALGLPSRQPSEKYTFGELEWYMSGSFALKDAVKTSKFWEKCSDDGKLVNSNYGALLFHKRNDKGVTSFEHALRCLESSKGSKKAVMVIYAPEHNYVSKDNPCTMYLHFRIEKGKLNCMAVMRSNDLFFGTPYDVRFFVFVQWMLMRALRNRGVMVDLGTYTHFTHSLHFYKEKQEAITNILSRYNSSKASLRAAQRVGFSETAIESKVCADIVRAQNLWESVFKRFEGSFTSNASKEALFMKQAWEASENSVCLKKKVGAVFTSIVNGNETVLYSTFGGAMRSCVTCARDDAKDKYYGDECPAVHAEMKGVTELLKRGVDMKTVKVYITHGPCDACLKLLSLVGVPEVVFDEPYKTDLSHWPNVTVRRLLLNNGNPGKPPAVDSRLCVLKELCVGRLDEPITGRRYEEQVETQEVDMGSGCVKQFERENLL